MTLLALGLSARLWLCAADVSVALPTFSSTPEVPAAKRDFLLEYFSQQLASKGGLSVTTPSQIAAVIGVERQKQLLGCSDAGGACIAELAGALGAEAIIVGSVGKVGDDVALTLKAIDARTGKVITSTSGRGKREEELLDFLSQGAMQIHDELLFKLRGIAPAAQAAPSRIRPVVWATGAVGVVCLVASATLFGLAKWAENRLEGGDPTVGDHAAAHQLAQTGAAEQISSAVLLGVGIAALATAALLYFVLPEAPVKRLTVSWLDAFRSPLAGELP